MPGSSPRRFSLCAPWIALVLAAAGGWASSASAQQATPGPLVAPAFAPNVTLDGTPAASGSPGASKFQSPKLLKHPTPAYPELAQLNRVEGVVRVHFVIDEAGHVADVTVSKTSGSVMLDSLIRDYTLREWTFQPAMLDGKPVPGGMDKEFEFKLDPNEQRALAEKRLSLAVGTPDPPYPPEALAMHPPPRGKCTVGVRWTKAGLVDLIYLPQASGSNLLDRAALRFAYSNWRTDTDTAAKDVAFTKTVTFTPP